MDDRLFEDESADTIPDRTRFDSRSYNSGSALVDAVTDLSREYDLLHIDHTPTAYSWEYGSHKEFDLVVSYTDAEVPVESGIPDGTVFELFEEPEFHTLQRRFESIQEEYDVYHVDFGSYACKQNYGSDSGHTMLVGYAEE